MLKTNKYILILISIFLSCLTIPINAASQKETRNALNIIDKNRQDFSKYYVTMTDFVISPDGSEIYVGEVRYGNDPIIYVVNAISGQIIKTIPIFIKEFPNTPATYHMVMSKDGKSLFVAIRTKIIRIDTLTKQIVAIISTEKQSSDVNSIAITPDGAKVIAADYFPIPDTNNPKPSAYLYIIDTKTNKLVSTIQKPKSNGDDANKHGFRSIVIDHNGKYAYLIDNFNASLAILDLETNKLQIKAIPRFDPNPLFLEDAKGRMAINSSNTLLYIAENLGSHHPRIAVLGLDTNTIIDRVELDIGNEFPFDVGVTPDDKKIYIAADKDVLVINARTNQIFKKIRLDQPFATFLQMTDDGKKVYVSQALSPFIWIIDTQTDIVEKTFKIENIKNPT